MSQRVADFLTRQIGKNPALGLQYTSRNPKSFIKRYAKLLQFSYNNLGSAHQKVDTAFPNSYQEETRLINRVAVMHGVDPSSVYGVCLGGSSLGILQGVFTARRRLGNDIHCFIPRDSHSALEKACKITNIGYSFVDVNVDGSFSIPALSREVTAHQDKPCMIMPSCGGARTGVVDNMADIVKVLDMHWTPSRRHIHIDAALGGLMMPSMAPLSDKYTDMLFSNPFIDSMNISMYKVLPSLGPIALFMTRKSIVRQMKNDVFSECQSTIDDSIQGSRCGIEIFIASEELENQIDDLPETFRSCNKMAEYLIQQVIINVPSIEPPVKFEFGVPCVFFPQAPSQSFCESFAMTIFNDRVTSNRSSHCFTLPFVTKAIVNDFVRKLELDVINQKPKVLSAPPFKGNFVFNTAKIKADVAHQVLGMVWEAGCRDFSTSHTHGNLAAIGSFLKTKPRHKFRIHHKIVAESVKGLSCALQANLDELQMAFVDGVAVKTTPNDGNDIEAWSNLERCFFTRQTRSLFLCDTAPSRISQVLDKCNVKPQAWEINADLVDMNVLEVCNNHGIKLHAYNAMTNDTAKEMLINNNHSVLVASQTRDQIAEWFSVKEN